MDICELSDLLGKKFEIGGRGPDTFDCYGLCLEIAHRLKVNLPEVYTPDSLEMRNEAVLAYKSEYKKLNKPLPWCGVVFIIKAPFISHMGIVLPDCKRFIHIMTKSKVSIERLNSIVWQRRIAGFYELTTN